MTARQGVAELGCEISCVRRTSETIASIISGFIGMVATSPRAFKERMAQVYEAYGRRPLLISEFAVADWGAKTVGQNNHSPEEVLKFMKKRASPGWKNKTGLRDTPGSPFGIHEAVGTSSSLFGPKWKSLPPWVSSTAR